jgi:hypothetical protein
MQFTENPYPWSFLRKAAGKNLRTPCIRWQQKPRNNQGKSRALSGAFTPTGLSPKSRIHAAGESLLRAAEPCPPPSNSEKSPTPASSLPPLDSRATSSRKTNKLRTKNLCSIIGDAQKHFDPLWGMIDPAGGTWFPALALHLARNAEPPLSP